MNPNNFDKLVWGWNLCILGGDHQVIQWSSGRSQSSQSSLFRKEEWDEDWN